jgi:hypothetical protein
MVGLSLLRSADVTHDCLLDHSCSLRAEGLTVSLHPDDAPLALYAIGIVIANTQWLCTRSAIRPGRVNIIVIKD